MPSKTVVWIAVVSMSAAVGLAGCGSGSGSHELPPVTSVPRGVIASGLEAPWSVVIYEASVLVSERDSGRIVEVLADGILRTVGAIPGVVARGEGGLLGLAVHRSYLYTYFTSASENQIWRMELTGGSGSLGLGDPEAVLIGIPAGTNHNGGRIAFGPDGMLYATTGDTGRGALAQDPESLAGKILRIAPDGEVPEDNPVPGSYIYSSGHRNPQGIAWDDRGTLYASEFGQNTWDELNVIRAGGNYGWPIVEGIAGASGFIDPVLQWAPERASPSGISVWEDAIYIAGLRGERLIRVGLESLDQSTDLLAGKFGRLRDVVVSPDGALWVLTNNTDGRGTPSDADDRILVVEE